ncbi:unnamed protein product [Amoebophrya sp. A120]|nr:unnamed protein product [Amoebophrya sp. A120]|eukprot:GSA120T00019515001.1
MPLSSSLSHLRSAGASNARLACTSVAVAPSGLRAAAATRISFLPQHNYGSSSQNQTGKMDATGGQSFRIGTGHGSMCDCGGCLQVGGVRAFSSAPQANPLEALLEKVPAGVKQVLHEPMERMSKQMDSCMEMTDKSVEHISGVVHALILLSRSNLISEQELDEKLGKLLPEQAVTIVKEQAKLLPADPYMTKLDELNTKLDALTKKVDGMGAVKK